MVFELARLAQLCDGVAVISLIAYVLTRTRYASVFITKSHSSFSILFMAVIGGFFYLYGVLTGVDIGPYFISIQVIGPVIAGLVAGVASGFFAGIIGIVLEYAVGYPIEPSGCAEALLSGIVGGVFMMWNKNGHIRISHAAILGCLVAGIQFVIGDKGVNPDILKPGEVVEGVLDLFLPAIIGLCVFAFIVNNLRTEAENSRKSYQMEGELLAATKIQMDSLPENKQEWETVSLAASLIPASYVGGDLYDYLRLDSGSIYFALGDVSGKGVPASLLMSSTRMILRSKLRETSEPCALVSEVNRSFLEDGDGRQFITLIVGIIRPDTGEVCYCNAGHPPPFLITKEGSSVLESEGNLPAGVGEDENFVSHRITLSQGDILTLVSDGVTEAERCEELYGTERVTQALSHNTCTRPDDVVSLLNSEVKNWTGDNPMSDDCTILAIGYYP